LTDIVTEDPSNVDDAQLERWAYGRATTPEEQERSALAAVELQRRYPVSAPSSATTTEPVRHPATTQPPTPSTPLAAGGGPVVDVDVEPRRSLSWRSRRLLISSAAAVAALGALVAGAAVVLEVLAPRPAPASSLDVFDRASTAEERALGGQLDRIGERVSIGPRVLDEVGFGSIVAFQSLVSSSGTNEPEIDLICVAVVEFNRRAQSTMINDTACVARAEFEQRGLEASLLGLGGLYDVAWGPIGRAQVDVTISDAQQEFMEPGLEAAFLDLAETDRDRQYLNDSELIDDTGISITQIRTVFPIERLITAPDDGLVDDPGPDAEWLAIYIGTDIENGDEVACLAVLVTGRQRERTCSSVAEIGSGGLFLKFERADVIVNATWLANGDVSASTSLIGG
jgi:hypothetical protein